MHSIFSKEHLIQHHKAFIFQWNKARYIYALEGCFFMLKIVEYKERQSANIEYDIYTPINIEFGTWNISKEPTIYWRTGDFKKSLIEIGLGKYSVNE